MITYSFVTNQRLRKTFSNQMTDLIISMAVPQSTIKEQINSSVLFCPMMTMEARVQKIGNPTMSTQF
jgi:hypothetical protein